MRCAIGRAVLAAWCAAVCACDDGGADAGGGGPGGDGVVTDGAPRDAGPPGDGAPPMGDAQVVEDAGPPPADGARRTRAGPTTSAPFGARRPTSWAG
jgi:hypothetical protein